MVLTVAEVFAQQHHCLANQLLGLVIAALALQLRCARAQLDGAGQTSLQLPARARAPRLANCLDVAQRQRIGALHHLKKQVFREIGEALHWRLCDHGGFALCAAHDLVRIARRLAREHLLAGRSAAALPNPEGGVKRGRWSAFNLLVSLSWSA